MQYILLMILKNGTVGYLDDIRPEFNAMMRNIERNNDSVDCVLNYINVFTKVKLSNMMIWM